MAQQLEMPAASLCVDYSAAPANNAWRVTAAQRPDIDVLRQLAARLKLSIAGIVLDASALAAFLPWLPLARKAWRGATSLIGCGQPGKAGAVCRALKPLRFTTLPAYRCPSLQRCATRSGDETAFDPGA